MATIKSYTDISQSKRLAEILSLESADMCYIYLGTEDKEYEDIPICAPAMEGDLCAWSLAALLGVLPKRIEIVDNVYELSVYLYGLYYWNINNGNLCFESKDKDNLVDACVDIIEKLNELKML